MKIYEFGPNHDLRIRICMIFYAQFESGLKTGPNQVKNPIFIKNPIFFIKIVKNSGRRTGRSLLNSFKSAPGGPGGCHTSSLGEAAPDPGDPPEVP